jgi:hypothetical protein
MNQRLLSLLAISAIVACGAVEAAEVSSLAGATTYEFGSSNYVGGATQTIAPGITWTSQYGSSVYGYTGGYGFGSNGSWDGQSMIGSNSPSAAMTISFADAVSGVGMLMQYAPGSGSAAVVNAYDAGNHLLDSYTLSFADSTPNGGQFVGFKEATSDIAYITMAGSYIGGAHLEVSAVPESSNLALMAAGLGLLGVLARRRKQA